MIGNSAANNHYFKKDLFGQRLVEYEKLCKAHHKKKADAAKIVNESLAERKTRIEDESEELSHLKLEARTLNTWASIQNGIDAYRSSNRATNSRSGERKRLTRMTSEAHHPTKELESMMRADGRAKPSFKHTAHHIVSGKGKLDLTREVRVHMHLHGVGINDPDNGVWMLKTKSQKVHWFNPDALAHKEIHTNNYEIWIKFKIEAGQNEVEVRHALKGVRMLIETNKQPVKVTMESDPNWDGR